MGSIMGNIMGRMGRSDGGVNILYTCDDDYAWLMGISVISLFENNKEIEEINVYLLGEKISNRNKNVLHKIAEKYCRDIFIIDVPELDLPKSLVSTRWPLSAFTRLYAGQLLPYELEKVLYLDCDTIINSTIKKLDYVNVDHKTFYGVKDCISKLYKKNIGLNADSNYINAGVLLINLSRLRRVSLSQTLNNYIDKYERLINYADQDVLNGAFSKEIGVLPPMYNVMTIESVYSYSDILKLRKPANYYSRDEIAKAVSGPVIIHYTTNMRTIRPWFINTNHPFATVFLEYMKISPWSNRRSEKMQFLTKEQKIIGVIERLPYVAKLVLGFFHSTLKPIIIRVRAR